MLAFFFKHAVCQMAWDWSYVRGREGQKKKWFDAVQKKNYLPGRLRQ